MYIYIHFRHNPHTLSNANKRILMMLEYCDDTFRQLQLMIMALDK